MTQDQPPAGTDGRAQPPAGAPSEPRLPPYAYVGSPSPYSPPGTPAGQAHPAPHVYYASTDAHGASGGYAPPAGWATTPQWPTAPAQPRSKTLARVALGLVIPGAVLAFVPFVSLLSGPLLLAAFVVSIVALASRKQGAKGVAVTSLVLSVVAWIASLVVAAVSWFAGIGSSDPYVSPDTPIEQPYSSATETIEPTETGFGRDVGDGSWWYAAVFETPAAHEGTRYLSLEIEALDAGGAVLAQTIDYIDDPVGTLAIAGRLYDVGGEIASISVRAEPASPLPAQDPDGTFSLGPLEVSADGSMTIARGELAGRFADDVEYAQVLVLARDPGGAIVDTAVGWVERLPGDGTPMPFEAAFFLEHPSGTTYEGYPSR